MARAFIKLEYDPTTMQGLTSLINQVDNYPNRLKSAKIAGTMATQRRVQQILQSGKYGNAFKYLIVEQVVQGKNCKITIKPPQPVTTKKNYGYSPTWGAVVAFYGRRAFRSKKIAGPPVEKGEKGSSGIAWGRYEIRPGSRAEYGDYISSFKVRAQPADASRKLDIKMESAAIFRNEIVKAIRRYGFGPRGGAPRGMSDLPSPRTRAMGGS